MPPRSEKRGAGCFIACNELKSSYTVFTVVLHNHEFVLAKLVMRSLSHATRWLNLLIVYISIFLSREKAIVFWTDWSSAQLEQEGDRLSRVGRNVVQVVLVQRCLRPSSRVEDEEHTSEEIKHLVARIQG